MRTVEEVRTQKQGPFQTEKWIDRARALESKQNERIEEWRWREKERKKERKKGTKESDFSDLLLHFTRKEE